jgi:heme exporter protein CcmD
MSEFVKALSMGNYGAYVWSAYAVVLAVVVGNIVWTRMRRRKLFQALSRFYQRFQL